LNLIVRAVSKTSVFCQQSALRCHRNYLLTRGDM
jgi:hypothetical protein